MFFFIRQHQAEQQLLLDQLCAEMFNNLLNSASGSTVGLIKHEGASINQSESRTVTSKQQRSKQKLTERLHVSQNRQHSASLYGYDCVFCSVLLKTHKYKRITPGTFWLIICSSVFKNLICDQKPFKQPEIIQF